MKLLSIAVPCYNSEDYMENCIQSLLKGGEDVEIIIVDDGSTKDRTPEIADRYAKEYPDIVKVVHQENGGHGSAVNAGLAHATGLYFKVVDSDDWLNEEAYKKVLETLNRLIRGPQMLDMLICNYVYEKQGAKHKRVMNYRNAFPTEKLFTWNEVKPVGVFRCVLMHSLIYRTELLRECGLELPRHTFYVDNLFAFVPIPYVKNMYYLDVNLYRYFIGREDQSVNEQIMIKRIDQQIKVNKLMIDCLAQQKNLPKSIYKYMLSMLTMITTVSTIMLLRSGTDENYMKKKELWQYLKSTDQRTYMRIRWSLLGRMSNLPGKSGRTVSVEIYKLVQKIYGFN